MVYVVRQYQGEKWKDLVDAFIRQYKFNMDVGPNRSSLQAMKKDNKESIR
jgi:hypothetical protein